MKYLILVVVAIALAACSDKKAEEAKVSSDAAVSDAASLPVDSTVVDAVADATLAVDVSVDVAVDATVAVDAAADVTLASDVTKVD